MIGKTLFLAIASLVLAVRASAADDPCSNPAESAPCAQTCRQSTVVSFGCGLAPALGTYRNSTFSSGATMCQSGAQVRCDDGAWKALGSPCAEKAAAGGKSCELRGHVFSDGAVSCQTGVEHRCEGGVWRDLGAVCSEGRPGTADTCAYNGATVANGSTICKSGVTFECASGEWRNLGMACE